MMAVASKSLLFFTIISLSIAVPNHRKVRQVREEDVRTISEAEMKRMTPQRRRFLNYEYTKEFFRPLK